MSDYFNQPDPVDSSAASEGEAEQPGEKQFRQSDGKFSPKQPVQESQREGAQQRKPGPIDGTSGELNKRANDATGAKPPAAAPPKAEAPKPPVYKFKSKIDGVEEEEEVPHDVIERERQQYKASQKRMQEAAEKAKRAEAMQRAFETGDTETLEKLGVKFDFDEFAAKRMVEKAQRALLPPHELELQEIRKRAEAAETELNRFRAAQAEAAQQAQDEAAWQEIQPALVAALEQHDIPRDIASFKLVASVLMENAESGIDLTPTQAAAEVARRQGARTERYVFKPWREDISRLHRDIQKAGVLDQYLAFLDADYRQRNGLHAKAAPAAAPQPKAEQPKLIFSEKEWKRSLGGG